MNKIIEIRTTIIFYNFRYNTFKMNTSTVTLLNDELHRKDEKYCREERLHRSFLKNNLGMLYNEQHFIIWINALFLFLQSYY